MLKMPGMGGPVPRQFGGAGEPGDLLLQVEVEPSDVFQRNGNDVSVSRTIDFVDAILGRDLRCALVGSILEPSETLYYYSAGA